MKLCGIRALTAFEMIAAVGDIRRFANPKKLVAYIGLNPSVRESADSSKPGRVRKRGCNRVRSRLIQAAKSFMRAKSNENNPVKRWGLAMKMRKGANKATVAVARKLTVAAWYLLNGITPKNLSTEKQVRAKLKKVTEEITLDGVRAMGYRSCKDFIEEYVQCFSLNTT
ncbi:MAG: transposase, partial [Lentisphaeria bacterium]